MTDITQANENIHGKELLIAETAYRLASFCLPKNKGLMPSQQDIKIGVAELIPNFSGRFHRVEINEDGVPQWDNVPASKQGLVSHTYDNMFYLTTELLDLKPEPAKLRAAVLAVMQERERDDTVVPVDFEGLDLQNRTIRETLASKCLYVAGRAIRVIRGVRPALLPNKSNMTLHALQQLVDLTLVNKDSDEGFTPEKELNLDDLNSWGFRAAVSEEFVELEHIEYDKAVRNHAAFKAYFTFLMSDEEGKESLKDEIELQAENARTIVAERQKTALIQGKTKPVRRAA